MTELLRRWLKKDAGMDVKDSFEKEFASGYKIAELLNAYNLQPDFDRFQRSGKPDALINNFVRLQPTLTNLGIKMDTNVANDIMMEKVGVAPKLLYAIKSHVEGLTNNLAATRTTKLGSIFGAETMPTAKLVESQRFRTEKANKDTGDLKTFEENLRVKSHPPNKLMEAMHLKKFEDEMIRQTRSARDGDFAEATAWQQARDTFRSSQLKGMADSRRQKSEATMSDFEQHRDFLAKQTATEMDELRVEMTLHHKRTARQQADRVKATTEVIDGIDAYENNLRRIGSTGEAGTDDTKLPPIGATPYDHIQRVRELAPLPAVYSPGAERYVTSLHTKKRDEAAARKEREARRRRVMVEQQRQQEQLQAKAELDLIVDTLQRESVEETRLAARLWQLGKEKDVVTENRLLREKQYKERRDADWRAHLLREAEMHKSLKEQFSAEAAAELEIWRTAEANKAAAKRKKHEDMCRDISWAVASIAFRAADYRETTSAKVPRKEYREWIAMFVAGDPALLEPLMKDDKVFEVPESTTALDEGNLSDYLDCVGEWDGAAGLGFNNVVGEMVAHLSDLNAKAEEEGEAALLDSLQVADEEDQEDEPVPAGKPGLAKKLSIAPSRKEREKIKVDEEKEEAEALAEAEAAVEAPAEAETAAEGPPIPDYPIKLAVIGAPFSGKTTVARQLAEALGLKVLSPVSVMDEAIRAAQAVDDARENEMAAWRKACAEAEKLNSQAPPEPEPEDPSTLSELVMAGRKIREVLQEGEEPSDQMVLKMLLMAIKNLGEPGVIPPAELPELQVAEKKEKKKDEKKDKKREKGKDVAEEKPCMGFVLDGFPATKRQSEMLEKALTGLDLSKEEARMKAASRVAPPPPDKVAANLNRALLSGLDHVFVLSVPDEETVIKRAVGRRVDPETGRIYHLEFDPPPTGKVGLAEKLQRPEDESNEAQQVQERLRSHVQESPPLEQWLGRFIKLRCGIDASTASPQVQAEALKKATALLKSKSAGAATSAAAAAAAAALSAARDARNKVLEAKAAAQAAARDLLAAKKAELMAALDLATDPAAADLVKGEASASCAQHVLAGNEALKAAEQAANQAEEAAKRAQEEVDKSIQTLGDAGMSAQSEIASKAAGAEAARAAELAAAAAEKAKESAAATAQVVKDALQRTEKAERIAETEAAQLAATATEAKAKKGAAQKPSKKVVLDEPSEMEQLLTLPYVETEAIDDSPPAPPPKPMLSGSMAAILYQQWQELETNYLKSLKLLFAALRQGRTESVNHFVATQKGFLEWLKRPDNRPILLSEFQRAFDAIDGDVRKKQEVIAELLLRADELRDALWDVCDQRLQENEEEHKAIAKDSYVADHANITTAQVQALLQVELDRFYATVGLAQAYSCAQHGIHQPTESRRLVRSQDLSVDQPPPRLEGFFNTKAPYSWPEWIAELEGPHPKLCKAVQILWGLVIQEARADPLPGLPGSVAPEEEDQPGTKGKKKADTSAPEETEVSKYNVEAVGAARELARSMVSREVEILRSRVKLLVGRVRPYKEDLATMAEHAHAKCEEWMRTRYRAECSSAQAVHNRVVEAIKAGTPLAHDLRLEGQELVVDEGTISAALPELPAVTRRPPPDNAGAPGSVLSTAQIAALAAGLREAAPSGYMLLTDAVRMLQRIGSRDGGTGLPQGWREATFTQLANALRLFDPHSTGYVAWHDLLGSLVAFAFPSIARATPSALAGAAAALSAAADRNGRVTKAQLLQTRLWYDTDGMSMAEREEELSKDQPYARSAELKGILFDALADVVPEGEEPKANWKPLLLYLCMDHDLLKGLQKAFAVLGSAGHIGQAETVTLGGRAVAQVAYPRGADGGKDIGRAQRTPQEVADVVKAVAEARGSESREITAEQLLYSLAGNKLVTEVLYWLQLKDAYSALRF